MKLPGYTVYLPHNCRHARKSKHVHRLRPLIMRHGFHKTDFTEQCLDHLYASEAVSITWDALRSTEHLYAYLQPEK